MRPSAALLSASADDMDVFGGMDVVKVLSRVHRPGGPPSLLLGAERDSDRGYSRRLLLLVRSSGRSGTTTVTAWQGKQAPRPACGEGRDRPDDLREASFVVGAGTRNARFGNLIFAEHA
jgi:hypothetical protein